MGTALILSQAANCGSGSELSGLFHLLTELEDEAPQQVDGLLAGLTYADNCKVVPSLPSVFIPSDDSAAQFRVASTQLLHCRSWSDLENKTKLW